VGARDLGLRHLLALEAVCAAGTYRDAAARLGVSQAAVTQQISTLERYLAIKVFVRPGGPRPVRLTPAGEQVLVVAREMIARADLLDLQVAALRQGRWGRLAIGTFQSVSARLLPPALAAVRAEAPDLDVSVLESDDNGVLIEALHARRLDATFLIGPVDDPDLAVHEVLRDPLVAVLPVTEPPVASITLAQLGDRALIGHARCSCHEIVHAGLAAAGVNARFVFRSNDNVAVQAMVRAGLGTAVMPRLALDADDPRVRIVPLDPPLPRRQILVGHIRDQPPAPAERFVQVVREVAAGLGG
jgi:DNA-binding transcriptional LysR family regulator